MISASSHQMKFHFPHNVLRLIILGCIITSWNTTQADPSDQNPGTRPRISFILENDLFLQMDHDYTHGFGISWISRDREPDTPECFFSRPFFGLLRAIAGKVSQKSMSFYLKHAIYTPTNLTEKNLIIDDRPYAGSLILLIGWHIRSHVRLTSLGLEIGWIGPGTGAECFQKTVHNWIDSPDPRGWGHQLKNEPLLGLRFDHRWRMVRTEPARGPVIDIIPHAGFGLGTTQTYLTTGGQIRLGKVPKNFGTSMRISAVNDTPNIQTKKLRLGLYGFLDLFGMLVIRDILLDGNTFRQSHLVDKHMIRGYACLGVGFLLNRTILTAKAVFESKQFPTQKKAHGYVSFCLSFPI